MNYHEWSKNASPYANMLSPEITSSTCSCCNMHYERLPLPHSFNPNVCYECATKLAQPYEYLDNKQYVGQFTDKPYGSIFGAISHYLNG